MKEIETKNLIIRNHKESDWEDFYDYMSLPKIYDFEPGEPVTSEESKSIIAKRCADNDFLAVIQKSSKIMIGHLFLQQCDPKHFLTWELGYIFNPKFQNQGYCSEASAALIKYAFEELGAHKVVGYCNSKNISSWKVMEKAGMKREGFFKQKTFIRKDNEGNPLWQDVYAYGILSSHSGSAPR